MMRHPFLEAAKLPPSIPAVLFILDGELKFDEVAFSPVHHVTGTSPKTILLHTVMCGVPVCISNRLIIRLPILEYVYDTP